MMVGLPASGKSTIANNLSKSDDSFAIHSSDAIRKELYGSADIQIDNNKVFQILHMRAKNDLLHGKNVCIDSTNISKKRRIHFLKMISSIPCKKICICVMTSYEHCILLNKQRVRQVPTDVIHRMYLNWNPPHKSEGWDAIIWKFNDEDILYCSAQYFASDLDHFDQKNQHHTLTLGAHLKSTSFNIIEKHNEDTNLITAALLHDIGKPFTQSFKNSKGIVDGNCHYYQHHCVGAYISALILNNTSGVGCDEIEDVSNLIYYHMHPYNEWKHSIRCLQRDLNLLGEEFVSRVMLLHEADKMAH